MTPARRWILILAISAASATSARVGFNCEKCPKEQLTWVPGLPKMYCKAIAGWCETSWTKQFVKNPGNRILQHQAQSTDEDRKLDPPDSEDTPDPDVASKSPLPRAPACGVPAPRYRGGYTIVGGHDAGIGKFPWMALIGIFLRNGSLWFKCGGSIITSKHVLSAAHCISKPIKYMVRVGEYNMHQTNRERMDVPALEVIAHPDYRPQQNDVAVLTLVHSVTFGNLVKPICLPPTSYQSRTFDDEVAISAGWGRTGKIKHPPIMQAVSLPVMTSNECSWYYPETQAAIHLCAGFVMGGHDTCQGDSGGPLMLNVTNQDFRGEAWVQIGIVSFGRRCAQAYSPGVYTRVDNYISWIEQIVRKSI